MYSYAYNNPFAFVDPTGAWPRSIHELIIDQAFPNLSASQRQVLKDASAQVDSLRGQGNDLTFQHAMAAVGESPAEAEEDYQYFVTMNEDAAMKTQMSFWSAGNPGLSDDALGQFGLALHAILDSTSPAHAGFQAWNVWNIPLVLRHWREESSISPEQLATAVSAARVAFNSTFSPGYLFPSGWNEFDLLQIISQPEQPLRESVTSRICSDLSNCQQ